MGENVTCFQLEVTKVAPSLSIVGRREENLPPLGGRECFPLGLGYRKRGRLVIKRLCIRPRVYKVLNFGGCDLDRVEGTFEGVLECAAFLLPELYPGEPLNDLGNTVAARPI